MKWIKLLLFSKSSLNQEQWYSMHGSYFVTYGSIDAKINLVLWEDIIVVAANRCSTKSKLFCKPLLNLYIFLLIINEVVHISLFSNKIKRRPISSFPNHSKTCYENYILNYKLSMKVGIFKLKIFHSWILTGVRWWTYVGSRNTLFCIFLLSSTYINYNRKFTSFNIVIDIYPIEVKTTLLTKP